ncbi:BlaI/MecI/CopY family transcriptional regulator [Clostridium beijerinckii]|uniref:BlaI/MecI/CopY family transcriptional regulator n=1 Tax=Clostridium beijerinckii TaxID=1520 RepID=UPI00098C3CB5|nr:BlaI/MecI/CopY family transcriptional regulator [Clostridium beijerinckii]MBA8936643.1 putative transcriptional regulator [Clostridium beijerinckii]NRU40889.1 putative transcriptional regulator [Clostridium beijerinckii]NSA95836.1 putative transcriptional regulator [Clostridium beijerinckii]OOM59350.1 penicillinase repressor [Clostridium beijerinckii]OOM69491.1 penicillinase repressor [Clostridium beijerinckii]
MKLGKISDAEMEIMKIIWKKNDQITTAEILDALPKENSWKVTTIMTLISRLTKKGILSVTKVGKLNNYFPKITEEQYRAIQTDNFLEDMHKGSVKNFMATLFNNKKISNKDIAELKEWLKEV